MTNAFLRPSRKLDADIAKEVTNGEWSDVQLCDDGEWRGWHIREDEQLSDSDSNPATSFDPIPHYSTDNAAADEILEVLDSRGIGLAIQDYLNGLPPFSCKIYRGRELELIGSLKAYSRPLAICHAALQALEINYNFSD